MRKQVADDQGDTDGNPGEGQSARRQPISRIQKLGQELNHHHDREHQRTNSSPSGMRLRESDGGEHQDSDRQTGDKRDDALLVNVSINPQADIQKRKKEKDCV